jgi:protein TonB
VPALKVDDGSTPPPPETRREARTEDVAKQPRTIKSVIIQGTAIRKVEPQYPRLAVNIGASGAVLVEVIIGEQGNVISARALSGHPILKNCAVEAARGWKWNPTFLNGVPVQVIGTITFNFNLNR